MLVRSLEPNGPDRADDRRFEVVTDGLPLCGEALGDVALRAVGRTTWEKFTRSAKLRVGSRATDVQFLWPAPRSPFRAVCISGLRVFGRLLG